MLETIKTRLRVEKLLTPEIERRIVEFERRCVAEIRSEQMRYAVIDFLENDTPLQFFVAPASNSGKNHPVWQALPGGILLNTVECCIAADRKIRMYPEFTDESGEPYDQLHDIVYVSTILSDTYKTEDYGK